MADRDAKGRFQKGHGTTRKGSPNRAKKDFIERVEMLVFGNWKEVERDMKQMDPKDRMRLKADLIKYILPAKRAVDATVNIDQILEKAPEEVADIVLQRLMNQDNEND